MKTATTAWTADGDFARVATERSHERLVLAAFVARVDEPPVPDLEVLCIDRGGCFDLVLVDPSRAPETAGRCEVSATPALCALRDGDVVARFAGDTLVADLRSWLEQTLPREAERAVDEAERGVGDRDAESLLAYTRALACNPGCARALLALARLHAADGDPSTALTLAGRVPPDAPQAEEAARLAEEVRHRVDDTGQEATLRARIAMDLDDVDTRLELVRLLRRRGRRAEADAMAEDIRARED